jgi:hypothetical protein
MFFGGKTINGVKVSLVLLHKILFKNKIQEIEGCTIEYGDVVAQLRGCGGSVD